MPRLTIPVSDKDHAQGPASAPVTLVEYGDFECPHCGRAYPIIRRLQHRFGDDLRFVYRHFPITETHPHAGMAAEAAEAAGAQGMFWEMHNQLFENQANLGLEDLVSYAARIGIDSERFRLELEERTFEPQVREDFMGGVRSGVNGTPTFYINGERYDGLYEFDDLAIALQYAASVS